jgi:hypothetical protein
MIPRSTRNWLNGAPGRGEKKKVKASETTAMLVITGMNPIVRNATTPRIPELRTTASNRASGSSTTILIPA